MRQEASWLDFLRATIRETKETPARGFTVLLLDEHDRLKAHLEALVAVCGENGIDDARILAAVYSLKD